MLCYFGSKSHTCHITLVIITTMTLFLVVGIGFYYCAICKNKYIGSSNLLPRSLVTRDVGTRLRLQIQKFTQFFHNSGTKRFNRKQPFSKFSVLSTFHSFSGM